MLTPIALSEIAEAIMEDVIEKAEAHGTNIAIGHKGEVLELSPGQYRAMMRKD